MSGTSPIVADKRIISCTGYCNTNNPKTAWLCAVSGLIYIFTCVSLPLYGFATNIPGIEDTLQTMLPELEVRQQGHSQFSADRDGSVKIKAEDITKLTGTFGEADFIRQIKGLSRVNVSSDYGSGLSVDGTDATHAQYLINGAPVIFPYRFGGIFSVFNTRHFTSMNFSRTSSPRLSPRLGPSFEFLTAPRFNSGLQGAVNIGMIASSATLGIGLADKVSINLSARVSYVDELYGELLKGIDTSPGFSFFDVNADIAFRCTPVDVISSTWFISGDHVSYEDNHYALDTHLSWQNKVASVGYSHKGFMDIDSRMWISDLHNRVTLEMPQFNLCVPSSLTAIGVHGSVGRSPAEGKISGWEASVTGEYHHVVPQWATMRMNGMPDSGYRYSPVVTQNLITVFGAGKISIDLIEKRLSMTAVISAGVFSSETERESRLRYVRLLLNPNVYFILQMPKGQLTVEGGLRMQPLHQAGFSELGLASNFWVGASDRVPLQRSVFVSGQYVFPLPFFGLMCDTGIYWKSLRNQVEYHGGVIEIIDTDYNPLDPLVVADGYNYGFSVAVLRDFGNMTGNISYSYGDGRRYLRKNPAYTWPALYSEGHSFKWEAVWHEGSHWELSASMRVSSGRRYTPIQELYTIGGNIAMEYGKRNSACLPLYQRLDVGATYYFSTGSRHRLRHALNLSLLNAYGHRNVEMQYFVLNSSSGEYSIKRLYSLFRFLPSISYSIEFK